MTCVSLEAEPLDGLRLPIRIGNPSPAARAASGAASTAMAAVDAIRRFLGSVFIRPRTRPLQGKTGDDAGTVSWVTGDGGLDPNDLETFLRVAAEAEALPIGHPDAEAVQRATAKIYKTVRTRRRAERRGGRGVGAPAG